ncbi:MAG: hypothetical protein U5J98_05380 [Halobacteriales archaeon]|nr:hypothetical protein [Halobacteriales archaeon]
MNQQPAADQFERETIADRPELIGTEHVHIRNHDYQWGYDLTLEIVDADGHAVFEDRYYLQPGQIESELDALPPGEYEVRATLDNLQEASLECRIGPSPEETVVVELGNGILSLTAGLRA